MAALPPIAASWSGAEPYSPPKGVVLGWWYPATAIAPVGIPAPSTAVTTTWVTKQQFVAAAAILPPQFGLPPKVTYGYDYRPPYAHVEAAWFGAVAYTPATGTLLAKWTLGFTPGEDGYILPTGVEPPGVGAPAISWQLFADPASIPSGLTFGARTNIVRDGEYTPPQGHVEASWFGAVAYAPGGEIYAKWVGKKRPGELLVHPIRPPPLGTPGVRNTAEVLTPFGIEWPVVFGKPLVWNFHTYVQGRAWGSELFGAPYVQGGVKYVVPKGVLPGEVARPGVINTTADQTAAPTGIEPPKIALPAVSPQILFVAGFVGTMGSPLVQRNPSPIGFDLSAFGRPTIIYKTRTVRVEGIDAFATGYPRVADRAFKLLHRSSAITSVFGDVALRLTSARVQVQGADSSHVSPWAEVRSTRRFVYPPGAQAQTIDGGEVRNKTPSLAPAGLATWVGGVHSVGWRVRSINAAGIAVPFGQVARPSLWQTPGLSPQGMAAPAVPAPVVGHGVRWVLGVGTSMARFGATEISFSARAVRPAGIEAKSGEKGPPPAHRVEYSTRLLLVPGALHDVHGWQWVSRRKRFVEPTGAKSPTDGANHIVAGTRAVGAAGFVATRWGTRIIPEVQAVYPLGPAGVVGSASVRSSRAYLVPIGFATHPQDFQRWGVARAWNRRQSVSMSFDPDSQLNPPAWPLWTAIANRNRHVGVVGIVASVVPAPYVWNGARAVLPTGAAAPDLPAGVKSGMVAFRIRTLPLEGLESPYMPGWLNVSNAARLVRPRGEVAFASGAHTVENISRRYDRVGGFAAAAVGRPFVADRIRSLAMDGRYAIAPPRVALPTVHLHTRFIEPVWPQPPLNMGAHALSIRWNIVTPRWTHRDWFGSPAVRNLTPELLTRGRSADEFGDGLVRLQWRAVSARGERMELFGGTRIADRKQRIVLSGSNFGSLGRVGVVRVGVPPLGTQYIWLDSHDPIEKPDAGHGIEPPGGDPRNLWPHEKQMGVPSLEQLVLYPEGVEQSAMGRPVVTANSIRVEPGIYELLVGAPTIHAHLQYVRVVSAEAVGGPGKPRLTPHTIYAVVEAPGQARANHPGPTPHVVIGESVVGRPALELRRRTVAVVWDYRSPTGGGAYGTVSVANKRAYLNPTGPHTLRMGWNDVDGGMPRYIEQKESANFAAFGGATVAHIVPPGPRYLRAQGFVATAMPRALVEHRLRTVAATGYNASRMGVPAPPGMPYAWQGLRIGPLMPTVPDGFDGQRWGTAWVSNRVRGITAEGLSAFASEYDYTQFDLRMRVKNASSGAPAAHRITTLGHRSSACGWTEVRSGRHYIRPDGNSDQHRKGAPS